MAEPRRKSVVGAAVEGLTLNMSKIGNRMSKMVGGGAPAEDKTMLQQSEPIETPWLTEEAGSAFGVSSDGSTLTHTRKGFEIAVADLVMTEGTHSFTFKVVKSRNGKGHNLYLGVIDAAAERTAPAMTENNGSKSARGGSTARGGAPQKYSAGTAGGAWGLHPFDGTVYYAPDAYQRGDKAWLPQAREAKGLTVKQVAELQHDHAKGNADGWLVTVVVNMDERTLSFGVNGKTPTDSRVKLPASVSPYAFFDWKDDAVALTEGVPAQLRPISGILEPPASDAKHAPPRSARGARPAGAGPPKTLGAQVAGALGSLPGVGTQSPVSAQKAGLNGDGARLQRALTMLLNVHKLDGDILQRALPPPATLNADGLDRPTLLAELDRLAAEIDGVADDVTV